MRARQGPSRVFTRILANALPPDPRGRSIVGDLMEEWHARPPGTRRAVWYALESLRLSLRYLFVPRRLPGPRAARAVFRGGGPFLDGLRQVLRRGLRAPAASLVTVLALGIGIGAPTAMYSLLVGVTRGLDVPDPDALVHIGRRYNAEFVGKTDLAWIQPVARLTVAGDIRDLEESGVFVPDQWDVGGGPGFAERRRGARVTPGVFRVLEVSPELGRLPDESDLTESAEPTVLLSHALWQSRFGGDPQVVGTPLRMSGRVHTVIGVMPPGFGFPDGAESWVPFDATARVEGSDWGYEMIGRLAPGGTLAGIRERLSAISAGLQKDGTIPPEVRTALDVQPWAQRMLSPSNRRIVRVLLLLVSFLLVIACANVVHLFLARALERRRAIAIRLALGAGRWRVWGEQMLEVSVLAGAGGVVGLAIAAVGVRALVAGLGDTLEWWMDIGLDPAVFAFAIGLVAVAALVTGIVPASQSARVSPAVALGDGGSRGATGRDGSRLIGALVTTEVALSCTLLVIGGLMIRGALTNLRTDGSYATESVLTAHYDLPPDRYGTTAVIDGFHQQILAALRRQPGVAAAGLTSHLPGVFSLSRRIELEGQLHERPEDRPSTHVVYVSEGFLSALDVAPLRGRDFRSSDGIDGPAVALVNQAFVRDQVGDRDPLGFRFRLTADPNPEGSGETAPWVTVVGVVPQLGLAVGRDHDDTGIYLPLASTGTRSPALLVRSAGEGSGARGPSSTASAGSLVTAVRREIANLDPDLAPYEISSLADQIRSTHSPEDLFAALFGVFGASGLLLAGVGLYGLLTFTVTRRMRELGIRSALGARPARVLWAGVRGGVMQLALGLGVGLTLAALTAPALGNVLLGYDPRDWRVYLLAALTLAATGLCAALRPALRATSIDVAGVLRNE